MSKRPYTIRGTERFATDRAQASDQLRIGDERDESDVATTPESSTGSRDDEGEPAKSGFIATIRRGLVEATHARSDL